MARQLAFLTTAVVATLGQTDVSKCGDLLSTDGKCLNDSTALLQVASVPEEKVKPEETRAKASNDDSGGPFGRQMIIMKQHTTKDRLMTSMNDWHSSRDLARVRGVHNVTISPKWTVQIFSAVPVFGKAETYIALLVERNGDAFKPKQTAWMQDFDTFVMFCAGPDGSHKTQVIARGHSWVCPWPREEWQTKRFNVFLEDKHGENLGMVVAEHDPKLLGQYSTVACVRDIFYSADPKTFRGSGAWAFSGVFKQWVEWMEWSSMHGLEHFLIYTFEGTDLAAKEIMAPYLDAGIASRVHFHFFAEASISRFGHLLNDCLYRAKNHAKWLVASVDVDEYMVFPGKVKYFNWDHILQEQGILEDKVASLQLTRVRFARARPENFEISSDHRVDTSLKSSFDTSLKPIIRVDNVYRTSVHELTAFKAGTAMILVDRKHAIINHYRIPSLWVDYEHYNFADPGANITDETLQKDIPLLEAAIAKRFSIQTSAVKGFLMDLALRRPPDVITAAAQHKMW